MAELIPINIVIGDRTYRLKLQQSDEEHVRKTVKLVNEKIVEFKTNFAGKDMQDYVSMVLIWYATQQSVGSNVVADADTAYKLHAIESLLNKLLNIN